MDDMLEGWRGVEEGGKSLKDACERLLEERVSSKRVPTPRLYSTDHLRSGQSSGTHR